MDFITIDIETLDTAHTATIVEIGAALMSDINGEVLSEFSTQISLKSNADYNRTTSPDTLLWWSEQAALGIAPPINGITSLKDALQALKNWWPENVGTVWARGPQFDITILESAFKAVDLTPPWKFFQIRDERTFAEEVLLDGKTILALKDYMAFAAKGCVVHRAIDDAVKQGLRIAAIKRYLRSGRFD